MQKKNIFKSGFFVLIMKEFPLRYEVRWRGYKGRAETKQRGTHFISVVSIEGKDADIEMRYTLYENEGSSRIGHEERIKELKSRLEELARIRIS